jgi:phospholipid/cholesterol/gamma-HCH transport system permease protein
LTEPFDPPAANPDASPALNLSGDGKTFVANGAWVVRSLAAAGTLDQIERVINPHLRDIATMRWDLTGITRLDHLGAQYFWNLWGKKRPSQLKLGSRQEEFFDRLYHLGNLKSIEPPKVSFRSVRSLGTAVFHFIDHIAGFTRLIGQLVLDLMRLAASPSRGPWREVSANVFRAGAQAVGITALVGFLIGVVLSYLSAQQLRSFGADAFIVNILGMSIIRELGPVLAAILVAGRSGSAITAQLGVMRVTEELDALLVMGIPHGFRLVLPRVLALAIAMPLLVVWTDAMALLGGMVSANASLGLSFSYFFASIPDAVSLPNLWLGVGKGAVFGMLIALTACHFGLRIEPNTESLGQGTTTSVVTSITIVILADALFAVLFKDVGI